ncbi:MAG: ABC transporter permease, partial [Bacteroidota bacterium]
MRIRLIFEGIRVAFRSLSAHRLRTSLTMLGVAIGIFAITIIFTLVNSLNYTLNNNLSKLGNTLLFVYHIP